MGKFFKKSVNSRIFHVKSFKHVLLFFNEKLGKNSPKIGKIHNFGKFEKIGKKLEKIRVTQMFDRMFR